MASDESAGNSVDASVAALMVSDVDDAAIPRQVETHVSVLTFDDAVVRKRKKPVRLPFIDFSTPELRLTACRNEVALNRRLAPDVYLGVQEIRDSNGQLTDAAVVMRRLPDDRRLATLVANGADVRVELVRIAHLVAAFHAEARRGPEIDRVATPEGLRHRWEADLDEWEPLVRRVLGVADLNREYALVRRYLAGRDELLQRRIVGGHIVDGHGDLLADDIFCLADGPRILDCLEFDANLRYGDELADVAFLVMDLEWMGRPDLAEFFGRSYERFAGEHFPTSLLHLYVAQRATVRSKVACWRVTQGDAAAEASARAHLDQCRRHLELARPLLIVIGGAPGIGKTTLAARLADTMGWVHLRSDEVRRDVAALPREPRITRDRLDRGIYSAGVTAETYGALAHEARTLLRNGCSVILDATFTTTSSRSLARRAALEGGADLVELECQAAEAVLRQRILQRASRLDDLSEATPVVAKVLAQRREVWPTAHRLDTTLSESALLVGCLQIIGETPVS